MNGAWTNARSRAKFDKMEQKNRTVPSLIAHCRDLNLRPREPADRSRYRRAEPDYGRKPELWRVAVPSCVEIGSQHRQRFENLRFRMWAPATKQTPIPAPMDSMGRCDGIWCRNIKHKMPVQNMTRHDRRP